MSYQVIARKWRPQSFEQLVGQDHISTTLLNALRNNRLPQALLFTGPRGTGKTSSARILAKSLRCENPKDFAPCGECRSCTDIAIGRSLDVSEIDGASNNGVDAIRELRDSVGYMPAHGKYKVYIIDEVHMLSISAFNALLKTLEEPPPHVIFILATTEVQKIPNTILSRCQRFDFRRIPSRQIAAQLEKICTADGTPFEQEALWLIARQADGSMRDSQSLLDQVITFSAGNLSVERVINVLGLTDRTLLMDALTSLVKRDSDLALNVVGRLLESGFEPKMFAQDLLEMIRHALMIKLAPQHLNQLVDLPDSEIRAIDELSKALSPEDLHLLFDMTLKGVNDLLRASDTRIVLEMLLLRMTAAPRVIDWMLLSRGEVPRQLQVEAPTRPQTAQVEAAKVQPTGQRLPVQTLKHETATTAKIPVTGVIPSSAPVTTAPAAAIAPTPAPKPTASVGMPAGKPNPFVRMVRPQAQTTEPVPTQGSPSQTSDTHPTSSAPPAVKRDQVRADGSHADGMTISQDQQQQDHEQNEQEAKTPTDPWSQFVMKVKKENGLLGALLENTHLIQRSQSPSSVTIGVSKKVDFIFEKLREPENLKRIEALIATIWNQPSTKIEIKLADERTQTMSPKSLADSQREQSKRSVEQAIELNPIVRQAQALFQSQIKEIKDRDQKHPGASTTVGVTANTTSSSATNSSSPKE